MGRCFETLAVLAVLAMTAVSVACAQTPGWRYRIGLDYAASPAWLVNRGSGELNWCPCDGRGDSFDHHILLTGSVLGPDALFGPVGIYASAGWSFTAGGFRSDPYEITPWYDQHRNGLVFPTAEFEFDASAHALHADGGLLLSLGPRLAVRAGGWVQWRVVGSFTQTEHLLVPGDQGYGGGTKRERLLAEGDRLAAPQNSWGPQLTLTYLFPIGESLSLGLELTGLLNAEVAHADAGLRSLGGGIGVSLIWGSVSEEEFPAPAGPAFFERPARIDTAAVPDSSFTAIDMFTLSASGERIPFGAIRAEQHYTRDKISVNPYVYFDRNSALIPVRYRQIRPGDPEADAARSAGRISAIDQYYDMLNVLGRRLSEQPAASITLTAYASSDEPASIASARAEAVQLYLRNVWGITGSRVRVETRPGRTPFPTAAPYGDAAHVVECSSPQAQLLEPVTASAAVREFHTVPIRLNPSIRAPGGVKEWTISIVHKGKEIAHYSSAFQAANRDIDVSLFLGETDDSSPLEPLHATLTVEDSSGRVTVARDVLDFKRAHDLFPADLKERVSVSSTFVMPSPLRFPANMEARYLLQEAIAGVRDGDRIRLYPLLERTGGAAIESQQETRRHVQHLANLVMIELGAKQAQIVLGPGEYTLPREIQLPELPHLASLLCITVEHELK